MDHKKEAIRLLGLLRQEHGGYDTAIAYLRGHVSKGGLTLADIGTSGEELERLRILGCAAAAKEWLVFLRSGTREYEKTTKVLRDELSKGGLTLADIGTSEEELERLRVLGCAAAAKEWLRILRPNGLDCPHYFNQLQREIAKGGLLLADIGTTEEEIALFNKWK